MNIEQLKKKYPSMTATPGPDNTEWKEGVERGQKKAKGKTFVMLDKNKSAKENLATLKKAILSK